MDESAEAREKAAQKLLVSLMRSERRGPILQPFPLRVEVRAPGEEKQAVTSIGENGLGSAGT